MAKAKRVTKGESNGSREADGPARRQALAMWALVGEGGGGFGSKLTPEIKKAEREALRSAGLVEVQEKEKRALWLSVTDKGWEWAEQHLSDALPEQTRSGATVLRAWLKQVQKFLKARDLRLYHLFDDQTPDAKSDSSLDYAGVRVRIRDAYHEAAGGFDRRLLLRDLRPKLTDIDRQLVDSALLRMVRDGEASLMQLDYRPDITDDDRSASLQIGNEPRHIIWIAG